MKKFYFVAVLATLALLCGCSNVVEEGNGVEVANTELSIGLPIGISRTAIDAEGNASWADGDTFALWAENKTGGFPLKGAKFSMMYYWHSEQSAVFTSNANTLAEGNYTYYAVSPMPESVSGLKATYAIPAEQDGGAFGAYDVMVAEPIEAEALSAEKINNLALDFNHKMHTLKMTIPEGKNTFSEAVSQIVFTFPNNVVGGASVSVSDPATAATVNPVGNILTINTPNGFDEGGTAWGVILPVTISGDVSYYAVSMSGQITYNRTFSLNKECKEGHITPLQLTIPEPISPTVLRFTISKNNLGEAVQSITILDSNGKAVKSFAGNSSNVYDWVEQGLYEDGTLKNIVGKTLTVRYESAHAIVENKVQIPSSLNKQVVNNIAISVPYLFYEDFTNIHTSFEKDDSRVSNLMEANGMLLNDYMSVSGWNGAHIKGVAGQSVRVNVRHQSTLGVTRSNGRLDSPSIKSLKSGASVKLKVEFDMGAYVNSGYSSSNGVFCIAGIHNNDESSSLNGVVSTAYFSNVDSDTGRVSGEFSSVCLQTSNLSASYNNDSFGSSFPTFSFTANNCSSSTRLCWIPCCEQRESTLSNNAHYYLYIDNIKVSIAQ